MNGLNKTEIKRDELNLQLRELITIIDFIDGNKKDYKNYYYLPMEDLVIHKSMKSFVDTTSIIRADKNNCYSKFTPGDSFLSAKTDVTNYCADIIYYILSEK